MINRSGWHFRAGLIALMIALMASLIAVQSQPTPTYDPQLITPGVYPGTHLGATFSVVAPPPPGSLRSEDLYAAVRHAELANVEEYTIYLLEGEYPLNEPLRLTTNITIRSGWDGFYRVYLVPSDLNVPMSGMLVVDGGDVTVRNLWFMDGRADNDADGSIDGGAIRVISGSLTITDSGFSQNSALGRGGAIHVENGTAVIDRVSFQLNQARQGGAISTSPNGYAAVTCANLTGNHAALEGGAFYGNGSISSSMLLGNSASVGGAYIYALSPFNAGDNSWATIIPLSEIVTANVTYEPQRTDYITAHFPDDPYRQVEHHMNSTLCTMMRPDNSGAAGFVPTLTPWWTPTTSP